jgi:glycosyltransferase involved in cell wall biosynthesis
MKPNLLFFIFRLHGGGAERMVSNLSMDFASRYNVKIAIFDTSEASYPYGGELLKIKLPFSGNTAENKWWAKAIRLCMLIVKLRQIKREHKIDVSISFGEQANIINILAGKTSRNILSVRTLLSTQISDFGHSGVLRSFVRLLYNKAYRVIVPSRLAAQDLTLHFNVRPDKLAVIYNYVDEERIQRLMQQPLGDPFLQELFTQPILLNVGRITRAKGQWLLPLLFAQLKKEHPSWRLVIIGEPEEGGAAKLRLTTLADELGLKLYDGLTTPAPSAEDALQYDIYLLGHRENPFQLMGKSRLLLFPSLFEGFPNTLLEAMKCGLPVISADCQSGPREILAPDTSLDTRIAQAELTCYGVLEPPLPVDGLSAVIAPGIIDEWARSTVLLMQDNDLRLSLINNGYRRVKDFDRKQTLLEWEKLISG